MILPADVENKSQNNNRVIVVLGVHRSGTSALARSLQVLGIGLGDNLHSAGLDNPKGFWEDRDCVAINEELLNRVGSEYDHLGLAWNFNVDEPAISDLYLQAIQLVSQSISKNKGIWGVKDPRICRLLGFWNKVFDACGCDVSYIISLRDPISVAESLQKRNNIYPEKSFFLWLQHIDPAILDSRDKTRIVVNYDYLIDAPEKQLVRIANCLNIPFEEKNNELLNDFLAGFLDNKLRHSSYSLSQISADNRIPYDTLKAYKLLMRVAQDEISIDSDEIQSSFEQFQYNLQAYAPAFSYANSLELEIERLGLHDAMSGHEELIANLPKNITTGKVQLMIALAGRDGEIANLNQRLAERDGEVANLNQMLVNSNEQITKYENQIFHLTQTIVERNKQITSLTTQLNEIYKSKTWYLIQMYRKIRSRMRWPVKERK